MRDFNKSHQPLSRISLPNRLVYTAFLLFAAFGMLTAILLAQEGPGWTIDSINRYYRGETAAAVAAASEIVNDQQGPEIELPDFNPAISTRSGEGSQIYMPRSYRALLENAHQHLFMMPVLFLILAHLFVRVKGPRWFVYGAITLSGVGLAGHIASPWLVRYCGSSWAYIMLFTLLALVFGMGIMLLGSLGAMWLGTSPPGRDKPGES
jgi:hypothetical protein